MNRTPIHRGYANKTAINLIHIQESPTTPAKIQKNTHEKGISHYSPHISKINFSNDQNATTRVQTNPVYDSRKDHIKNQNLEDWKILTLKQIKRSKIRAEKEEKNESCNKSRQKIFVSISKSNRSSTSKEHKNSTTPSRSQLSESDFKHLEGLSKKRFIVQKVENQIEVDKKSASIFCE